MLGLLRDRLVRTVVHHNRIVVVVLLLLTAGVAVGVADLNTNPDTDTSDAIGDTDVAQKDDYIEQRYLQQSARDAPVQLNESQIDRLIRTQRKTVYVHDPDGNVLSKPSLVQTLRFQNRLHERHGVGELLGEKGEIRGVATLVATRIADERSPTLDEQFDALSDAQPADVQAAVQTVLGDESVADRYMPTAYETGATTAESRQLRIRLVAPMEMDRSQARLQLDRADRMVYESARAVEHPDYFTLDSHAYDSASTQRTNSTFQLIVPFALVIILGVLAFVYRDPVDIVIGFTGVLVSLVWMFGILGWLGVPANAAIIVGPVLIVGLSVDYGLHVFMRYREHREFESANGKETRSDDRIREPMTRSLRSVAVALALVTVTTAVGFAANVTNEFTSIRALAIGISVGVLGSFVVFVTLVPALKVSVDGLLERVGLDRRRRPFGQGRVLAPLLRGGVVLARRAAPLVLVVALIVGAVSAGAWGALDRQGMQEKQGDVAEWKQNLPDPVGWDRPDAYQHADFVDETYRSAARSEFDRSQILIQGPVTDPAVIDRIEAGTSELAEAELLYRSENRPSIQSPLTAINRLSARNETVAAAVENADTDGDGIPDQNLETVYDTLFDVAPDQVSSVIERTDRGEYLSLRMVVTVEEEATLNQRTTVMQSTANTIDDDTDLTVTAVGRGPLIEAESIQTAQSILQTLVIALVAVFLILMVAYRLAEGSATLGAVTMGPIVLVTALLVGSMYILDIPLTVITALLMSLVVGLGIDYSIHISDRFSRELDEETSPAAALDRAVTRTGGVLLGSTLTSAGAFTAILLHPSPQVRSFGTLVVLAMTLSFVVCVYVLPSILILWYRHIRELATAIESRLPDALGSE